MYVHCIDDNVMTQEKENHLEKAKKKNIFVMMTATT